MSPQNGKMFILYENSKYLGEDGAGRPGGAKRPTQKMDLYFRIKGHRTKRYMQCDCTDSNQTFQGGAQPPTQKKKRYNSIFRLR